MHLQKLFYIAGTMFFVSVSVLVIVIIIVVLWIVFSHPYANYD